MSEEGLRGRWAISPQEQPQRKQPLLYGFPSSSGFLFLEVARAPALQLTASSLPASPALEGGVGCLRLSPFSLQEQDADV